MIYNAEMGKGERNIRIEESYLLFQALSNRKKNGIK